MVGELMMLVLAGLIADSAGLTHANAIHGALVLVATDLATATRLALFLTSQNDSLGLPIGSSDSFRS